jgi:hypothetical protein
VNGLRSPSATPSSAATDEPELVAVLEPAIDEGSGVGAVVLAGVRLAVLAVGGDTLALQIAQVGGDGLALRALQFDHPCLDHDPAGPVAHAAAPWLAGRRLPAAVALERGCCLAPAPPRIKAPARLELSP